MIASNFLKLFLILIQFYLIGESYSQLRIGIGTSYGIPISYPTTKDNNFSEHNSIGFSPSIDVELEINSSWQIQIALSHWQNVNMIQSKTDSRINYKKEARNITLPILLNRTLLITPVTVGFGLGIWCSKLYKSVQYGTTADVFSSAISFENGEYIEKLTMIRYSDREPLNRNYKFGAIGNISLSSAVHKKLILGLGLNYMHNMSGKHNYNSNNNVFTFPNRINPYLKLSYGL